STHVRGIGSYADGVEKPRIQVTLATGIPEAVCRAVNLGYRDPGSIHVADYQDREEQGILCVPKAGEMLYRLHEPPAWARGEQLPGESLLFPNLGGSSGRLRSSVV